MKKFFFVTIAASFMLACTKDKSVSDLTSSNDTKVSAQSASDPSASQHVIHITASGFSPDSTMFNVNNTVEWINDDKISHTVTSDKFDSGDIPPGGSFKYYFDDPGTYHYACRYHGEKGIVAIAGIR